jgi:hypothetical protein
MGVGTGFYLYQQIVVIARIPSVPKKTHSLLRKCACVEYKESHV